MDAAHGCSPSKRKKAPLPGTYRVSYAVGAGEGGLLRLDGEHHCDDLPRRRALAPLPVELYE